MPSLIPHFGHRSRVRYQQWGDASDSRRSQSALSLSSLDASFRSACGCGYSSPAAFWWSPVRVCWAQIAPALQESRKTVISCMDTS